MKKENIFLILGIIVIVSLFFIGAHNKQKQKILTPANLNFQTKEVPIKVEEINPKDLNISKLKESTNNLDNFAKCLREKGVELYVLKTCPHCAHQKEMFGSSLKYLNYIECSENMEICNQKQIEAVPTWILPNGERLLGVQPLEILSQKTGCKLK
ncbi:MAG: hypothetical protein ACP5JU_02060 [Minisyncoccia bacterium]